MARVRHVVAVLLLALLAAPAAAVADPSGDFEQSWLHRTLAFQYRLGNSLPLRNATLIGTHNSFNSSTERRTLSDSDFNQQLTLTDQLRLDVRSLEIDAHYINTLRVGGGKAVVACHGRGADQAHLGCTTERLLSERLTEVRRWLDANPTQVILLSIEDHMDTVAGHDAGAQAVLQTLGDRVYRPPATGACTPMPLDLTRGDIRRAGAQVLLISSCGPEGSGWRGVAFDDAERAANQRGPAGFGSYPRCDGDRTAADYQQHFIRYFEDSTKLSSGVGLVNGSKPAPLTAAVAREMDRCGVDLFGFDQLRPGDDRLAALAWSWAPGSPTARPGGTCAEQRANGRWRTDSCTRRRAFACEAADGTWTVDPRAARYRRGGRRCPGAPRFSLPRTANEAQRLRDAMRAAGVSRTWVAYRR